MIWASTYRCTPQSTGSLTSNSKLITGYHQFAGKDAARAYVTGCFKIHLTHDVRGFNEQEMKVGHPSRPSAMQYLLSPTSRSLIAFFIINSHTHSCRPSRSGRTSTQTTRTTGRSGPCITPRSIPTRLCRHLATARGMRSSRRRRRRCHPSPLRRSRQRKPRQMPVGGRSCRR